MSDEWERITEGLGTESDPFWQHVDNPNAVSEDGGETYYMIDEPVTQDGSPRIYNPLVRPVVHRDYPKDLAQAVHFAIGRGSVAWEDMSGTGVFQDDLALEAANDLIDWINTHYEKKENAGA